jgi:hypothetical protein
LGRQRCGAPRSRGVDREKVLMPTPPRILPRVTGKPFTLRPSTLKTALPTTATFDIEHITLRQNAMPVIAGGETHPRRSRALQKAASSVYGRDPDGNPLEFIIH